MILITGGLGYIGSNTVVELLNRNQEVHIWDNLANSNLSVLDGIAKITGKTPGFTKLDVCDYEAMAADVQKIGEIDAIIHFAAFKSVKESVEKPEKYYRNNVWGMLQLLRVMEEFQISAIVFSSSCTVYGQPENLPVTEETPFQPAESPYGNSKKICEDILSDAVRAGKKLKVVSLRYFNPVGTHESAEIGENPNGIPDNLMPFITQTAAGIREELTIFGNDYNTPDGSAIRDYIHVSDLAEAHLAALNFALHKKENSFFEPVNVGTGNGVSVMEIVHAFQKYNRINLPYKVGPRRKGDIEKIWAETTKAKELLGWHATRGLKEMVTSAWKWQQKSMA